MKRALFCALLLALGWLYWTFISATSQPAYPRTVYWIRAAECARATGKYLVVCDASDGVRPIEDVSLADDRGHTLLLSLYARLTNTAPTESSLRNLNLAISLFGFLVFVCVLIRAELWRSAIFAAALGSYWLGARGGPDVDAVYMGIAAMSASALLISIREKSLWSLVAVFFLLTFTALIREPVGLGAAAALFISAIAQPFVLKSRGRKDLWRAALLIVIVLAAMKVPSLPTRIRDAQLGTHATGTAAHGLSHNLFLGLGGFVENKWGIVWDDAFAEHLMMKLHPEIAYCSDAYFSAIGKLYWSYVKEDPAEALRVYMVKTVRTFSSAEGLAWSGFISLGLMVAIFIFARHRKLNWSLQTNFGAMATVLFAFSFFAQGILTHPAWNYIHPGPILLMIACAMISERVLFPSTKAS